ncbi:hypothetical protein J1605_012065 [Eschrichtius robustus]|uniref:Uncharacterized protein n=1 Tax=Eschrichtius robustus TaxID=9764 RepID=A0AB34GKA9_ESCRO|nr:hypothetical protein J1605_012065 [Eschrichtius robustus]
MRGDSYFIGMRSLGQQGHIPEDGGLFLLCCIDRDWAVTQCFTEEAFQAITDFTDLPNSLFACNVHQSVFEGDESKSSPCDPTSEARASAPSPACPGRGADKPLGLESAGRHRSSVREPLRFALRTPVAALSSVAPKLPPPPPAVSAREGAS